MILTNYFLRKKINSFADAFRMREGYFRSFEEVRHILVFYDLRDRESIALYMEKLRKLHKEVRGCVLVSSAPARPAETASGDVSGEDRVVASGQATASRRVPASGQVPADYAVSLSKNLNVWGFPSEATRRAVDALPADLLIDLTRRHCYAMQYLVLRHPSRFKVGPKRVGFDLYDLSIVPVDRDDTAYLFDQILFYLQAIHS